MGGPLSVCCLCPAEQRAVSRSLYFEIDRVIQRRGFSTA